MKFEIPIDEIQPIFDKIWDLHDKISDTIHSISRTHFIHSTQSILNNKTHFNDGKNNNGFVYVKDFVDISEVKSLNSIRSALENLEDQLEFFHTMQVQRRVESDAALARLEQSRIILALRLAEHHGKKYEVIDEAINFVGDVRNTSYLTRPTAPAEQFMQQRGVSSNVLVRVLLSGFDSAKKTLQLDKMGGVLGNAALFALSILALLHLHQVTDKNNQVLEFGLKQGNPGRKLTRGDGSSTGTHLDVRLARG